MSNDTFSRLCSRVRFRPQEIFTPAPPGFAREVIRQAFSSSPEMATPEWSRSLTWGLAAAVTFMLVSILSNHRALTDPLSTERAVENQLAEFVLRP